jgi:hypothetical protein
MISRVSFSTVLCFTVSVLSLSPSISSVHAQQSSLTPNPHGFDYNVTGIEESGLSQVEAVTQVYTGSSSVAMVTQGMSGNRIEEQNVRVLALIQDSVQNNVGIVNVNQNAGNVNNQANVRVLNILEAARDAGPAIQEMGVWGSTKRVDNMVLSDGGERETRISNSLGGTVGILGVNQSAGNLNQQANVLVLNIGLGLDAGMASLGDGALGEVNSGNSQTQGAMGTRTDAITDSFLNFRGIAQVTQSSGDLNAVGNYLGISAQVMNIR